MYHARNGFTRTGIRIETPPGYHRFHSFPVACSFAIGKDAVLTSNGLAGQVLKMDLQGNVVAAACKPGTGLGEFGEAHFIAVSPKGEIFVADSVNGAMQKFVKR